MSYRYRTDGAIRHRECTMKAKLKNIFVNVKVHFIHKSFYIFFSVDSLLKIRQKQQNVSVANVVGGFGHVTRACCGNNSFFLSGPCSSSLRRSGNEPQVKDPT